MAPPVDARGLLVKALSHDKELLEKYAPVLRFSAGERFFPMNVRDFVEKSKLWRGNKAVKGPDAQLGASS